MGRGMESAFCASYLAFFFKLDCSSSHFFALPNIGSWYIDNKDSIELFFIYV